MTAFDLVIFDCDGTLVDSEYLHNKVVADALTLLGLTQYTAEHCMEIFAGKGMEEVVNVVQRQTGFVLPATFIEDYTGGVNARIPELLKKIDDVQETIAACRTRLNICIGSNGERINVLRMVEAAGLSNFFPPERIFTKDMVRHAKPAPDLFLLAAARMGAQPDRTLVIEDSTTGARAGIAAGMTVVGFTATFHDRAAQARALKDVGAHHITDRFADILAFIDGAGRG